MLPSVKGVDNARAHGQATIKTEVKTFIAVNELIDTQNAAATNAISKITIVKYLLTVFEKFVNLLSVFC